MKIVKQILGDNLLLINRLFKKPSNNIWEVLSTGIFNSPNFTNEIMKKFEDSLDYIENKPNLENNEFDLFNNNDIELKFETVSKIYNMKIIIYNINYDKFSLQSKIFGNLKNNKIARILIDKNQFYNILTEDEELTINYNNLFVNKNLNEKNLFEISLSTNDSKEFFNYDFENKINLSELDSLFLFLNGKTNLKNINLPYNLNLLINKDYLKALEKVYPRSSSNPNNYTFGIKELEPYNSNLQRSYGGLKFFDKTKGFGFFVNNSDNSDLFVHYDDLNKLDLNFDIFKLFKKEFYLGFSYIILEYYGKHDKSKKAINIKLEEIKLIKPKITN